MDGMHHPGSYSARLAPMTWKLCAKQDLGIRCCMLCAALSRLISQIAGLAVGNASLFSKVREGEKKEEKVVIIVRQDCPCCRPIKEKSRFDGAMSAFCPNLLSRIPDRGPLVGLRATRFNVGSVREEPRGAPACGPRRATSRREIHNTSSVCESRP